MEKICFGVDLGGTTVKMGIFTAEGKLIEDWEIPTRKEENGKYILSDIAESINDKIKTGTVERDSVIGVGIGVPGPVTSDGVVKGCANLGWGDTAVEKILSGLTGFEVKAGNDANVAALGEAWQGGGKGCDNLVMVTLGTGVGGGIILNGRIVTGTNGAAGEIGHMPVVYDETETCGCGKKGCLEQVASATGIVKETKKLISSESMPSVLRDMDGFTAKDVFDAAKSGDVIAVKAVNKLGDYLGTALSHISCVIDPEVFVIGGGVSKAGTFLTDAIQEKYVEKAFHASRKTPVRLATLGNSAGIYGAARLVLC